MDDIVLSELEKIIRRSKNIDVFSSAKATAARMAYDYLHNFRKIEDNPQTRALFAEAMLLVDSETLKHSVLDRFESENPTMHVKRTRKKLNARKRAMSPDEIEENFCRTTLDIYRDMARIKKSEYEQYKDKDIKEIRKFLSSLPDMTHQQEMKFAELFVRKHRESIDSIPPVILANAYQSLRKKVESGVRGTAEDLCNILTVRIDELAAQFSLFDGKSVTFEGEIKDNVYNFVDVTNVANTADGYRKMFIARLHDFPKGVTGGYSEELRDNVKKLDNVIGEYDDAWNLHNVGDENVTEKRFDALNSVVAKFDIPNDIKEKIAKYKFLDSANNEIPQFVSLSGEEKVDYVDGDEIISGSRLAQIIDLARNDVIMRHVANSKRTQIDETKLKKEFYDRVLFKLFEIDTVAKNHREILEHPEQFTSPEFFDDFKKILDFGGTGISDLEYNAAMKSQVDQTLGFAARLQEKLKPTPNRKRGRLFEKLLKPLDKIDENKDVRLGGKDFDSKQKVEFFKNIFKTFGNGLLVSAGLSLISIGAATLTGVSLPVAVATVSIASGITIAALQIRKWQKTHNPNNLDALLADKQMLIKLGVTGFAALAMIFGGLGFTKIAMAFGYGSLLGGVSNNAVQMFKAAKSQGFSVAKSVAFSLATVIAGATGAFLGRAGVMASYGALHQAGDAVNTAATTNEHDNVRQEPVVEQHKSETIVVDEQPKSHFETKVFTSQEGIDDAKQITNLFYQDDLAELQRQVDLIDQYNQTHGTTVDPHRVIMFRADAGGKVPSNYEIQINDAGDTRYTNGCVKVFGPGWLKSHPEFSVDDINQMKNLFNSDGCVNEAAMNVAQRLEMIVSPRNEVGAVQSGDQPLYNTHLMKNYTDVNGDKAFNTYVNGNSAVEVRQIEVFDEVETPVVVPEPQIVPVVNPQPVVHDEPVGMVGMIGMSGPKIVGKFRQFKKRLGTFFDTVLQR